MNIRYMITTFRLVKRSALRAWKPLKWTYTNLAVILGYLSFLAIGPTDIDQFLSSPDRSMEEVIRAAELDSVDYTIPSSEAVVVKVMHHSTFGDTVLADDMNVLLSQVSPFQPANMGTLFRGGDRCRFLGKAKGLAAREQDGYVEITEVSCVDDRGIAFTLSATPGRRLGFVTNVGDAKSTVVHTVRNGKQRALRQFDNVLIRFDRPVMALVDRGSVKSL